MENLSMRFVLTGVVLWAATVPYADALAQNQPPLEAGVPSSISDSQMSEVETRLGRRLQTNMRPILLNISVVELKSGDKVVCGRVAGIQNVERFRRPEPFVGIFLPPNNPITSMFAVMGYTDRNLEMDIRNVCKERGISLPFD